MQNCTNESTKVIANTCQTSGHWKAQLLINLRQILQQLSRSKQHNAIALLFLIPSRIHNVVESTVYFVVINADTKAKNDRYVSNNRLTRKALDDWLQENDVMKSHYTRRIYDNNYSYYCDFQSDRCIKGSRFTQRLLTHPITEWGYFIRSQAASIPPYEPPKAITGLLLFCKRVVFKCSIRSAKSANACSELKYPMWFKP